MFLVENAQHLLKAVVHLAPQQWYLHDDAVVLQAFHKLVGHALGHLLVLVVVGLVAYVDNGVLDMAHPMAEQIDGHHGHGKFPVLFLQHVLLVVVLERQIAAEAQRFGGQPRFLQFDERELGQSVLILHFSREVDAKHGDGSFAHEGRVFVTAHFHVAHLLLEQGRENSAGNAFILHEVFEHGIVEWVGNVYGHMARNVSVTTVSLAISGGCCKYTTYLVNYQTRGMQIPLIVCMLLWLAALL